MLNPDLYSLKNDLIQSNTFMLFSGPFSQGIIEEIGIAVRERMESTREIKISILNVFSVFIEQAQNIRNYARKDSFSEDNRFKVASGIVLIHKLNDKYSVKSGNLVLNEDCQGIIDKINHINQYDQGQLKNLYKEKLRKELPDHNQGAGLGLIEMARRASAPLHFSFKKIDAWFSFFELTVILA